MDEVDEMDNGRMDIIGFDHYVQVSMSISPLRPLSPLRPCP